MSLHLLDTNTVSHLIRGHPAVVARMVATPMASLCISAVTEGEMLFGLAKRPGAKRLHLAVHEFLLRVDVLPWDSAVAQHYGSVRANMERQGKVLAPMDMMIAAHALSVGATLVSNDRAFGLVTGLSIEDWTI